MARGVLRDEVVLSGACLPPGALGELWGLTVPGLRRLRVGHGAGFTFHGEIEVKGLFYRGREISEAQLRFGIWVGTSEPVCISPKERWAGHSLRAQRESLA